VGLALPPNLNTPYINTIPIEAQPPYPGDREIERRIKNVVRWNAMAMVVQANTHHHGIGGHISTFASVATLFEVGFHHFFRAPQNGHPGDQVYFQGHASPGGVLARLPRGPPVGRSVAQLPPRAGSRRRLVVVSASAPHAGVLAVSHCLDGLVADQRDLPGALQPLSARARADGHDGGRVWAFLGDGEMDEPEAMGALTLGAREQLDNLIFVINCNLQRLDGPVRGNARSSRSWRRPSLARGGTSSR